ncbi:hypothetical protein LIER_21164 [Lithospermum erythrorhizon]|uniref:RING-type E3 ubiquitin transferase n=1 Tax=Lithospermum erythrorhizon TaxID=34254 RepID=A0AAV3QP69_LITER
MRGRPMELEYKDDCSKVNCDFFGGGKSGKRPNEIHFRSIGDTGKGVTDRLRSLLVGGYDNRWGLPLDPNVSLVSEGKWDKEKKRLDMVGCRIIGGEEGEGSIGDCSVRVSLRVPSKWTWQERDAIVGEMWSTKQVNESGYFGRVHLRTSNTVGDKIDNLTYEYREIENLFYKPRVGKMYRLVLMGGLKQMRLGISDKVLFSSLPLYVCGGLTAWFVAHVSGKSHPTAVRRRRIPRLHNSEASSLWGGLKSYAGLTLDGFLLPQILFNIFSNSKEKALSPVFYVGTTIVRLLPHAYDIYRVHDPTWSFSFIYANPRTDY